MKQLAVALSILLLAACGESVKLSPDGKYGEAFSAENALTVPQLMEAMKTQDEMNAVVSGVVTDVCQSEGCWLILQNPGGEELYIDIKDKTFHLPSSLVGKHVVMNGVAFKGLISVEEQKQMARENGKTEAEIAAITAPKEDITMEVSGLMLK